MTRAVPDLACRELVELVTDYLDERLSPEDRTRFELHLSLCDGCATYLRQVRQVIATAGRLSEENVPDDAREALLGAFRSWKRRSGDGEP